MNTQKKLTNEELASFCSQVAVMLKAGITPIEGLRILLSDTTDAKSKALLEAIIDSISDGNSFAEALTSVGVFPDYVLNTLKLGEDAGVIDEVMNSLAEYYERETQIVESIRSAVTYPLIMIGMMLLVIVILITNVLPIFNQVYVQLGSEMTGFAAGLLRFGNTLKNYSVVFIVILAVIIGAAVYFTKTPAGKEISHKIFTNLPMTRKFYNTIAAGRFASGMAIAMTAGLDTFESLNLVGKLVENKSMTEKIDVVRNQLLEGEGFADAIKTAGIFSNVDTRMVAVGYKSGEIESVMRKIAEDYERKSEKKISEIISVIEPTLVIVLSVIVGLILLSVILPLMGIMSTIG
ncbi:MAG: type II secretion system F family protein [Lachnospiraceae bacterium]|nr:type II secretion system F family protein [Lachnospiraceae bacterium]